MGLIYIAAAIVSWTALAFVYRLVEHYRGNRFSMAAAMGATSAACALAYACITGCNLATAGGHYFGFGGAQGAVQAVLIPIFMVAVSRGDLSVTWTILTLSFALASTMSLIYPGAQPSVMGITGLLTALAAIALLGVDMRNRARGPENRRPRPGWLPFMAVSFVLNAAAMYAHSLPAAMSSDGGMESRLAFVIGAGTIFSLGGLTLLIFGRKGINYRAGVIGGLAGGTVMFVGTLMTFQALSVVPDYIVYSFSTGGSGVLVVVLSVLLLKERPGGMGWLGIGAGIAALVLFAVATGG